MVFFGKKRSNFEKQSSFFSNLILISIYPSFYQTIGENDLYQINGVITDVSASPVALHLSANVRMSTFALALS